MTSNATSLFTLIGYSAGTNKYNEPARLFELVRFFCKWVLDCLRLVTASFAAAVSAAAKATASTASTAAATSGTTLGSRASFADSDRTAAQVLSVHFIESLLGFFLGGHFYKSKSPRLTAKLVLYDAGGRYLAKGLKSRTQFVLGCGA
jgi:hypothetical protein